MASFITADLHLGEDRMGLMSRPFVDGDECMAHMIKEHNALVKPEDSVIIAGDLCYQKRLDMLPMIAKFNGHKTLIRGNHDRGLSDADLAPYFEVVVPEGDGIVIESVDGIRCFATHYPTCGKVDCFNLVGHIHSAWKVQKNMLNVGVDVHHFRPVNLDRIIFHFNAICQYYDEDVWVAYASVNQHWHGFRGKKGTYFTKHKEQL